MCIRDRVYAVNVEALSAAQPKDLDASEIEVGFFNQFIYQNGIDIHSIFTGKMSMAKRINNFKYEILKGHFFQLVWMLDFYVQRK